MQGRIRDLVAEEDPLAGVNFGGLDPGVAREVDRAAGESLDDDAFQEELLLVPIQHRDGSRRDEAGVHHELSRVHHPLPLHILLLEPVPEHCLAAFLCLLCPFDMQED